MSSIRRQELERSFPPAPQSLLRHLHERCREAGISLTEQDLIFIGRATTEYLSKTSDGRNVCLKLLNATVVEGSYMRQYFPEEHYGVEEKRLDPRHLKEYRGWIYKDTMALPWTRVDTVDKPHLEPCDACGGLFPSDYCATIIRQVLGGTERLQTLCNRCRQHSPDSRTRDGASGKKCQECRHLICQFHPRKQEALKAPIDQPPHPADQVAASDRKLLEHKPQPAPGRRMMDWDQPQYRQLR